MTPGERDDDPWGFVVDSPRRFLTSSAPWRALVYLVSGAVAGASSALVVVALLLSGVGLLVVGVGALILVLLPLLAITVARWERARLRLLDPVAVADPHADLGDVGLMAAVRTRLREPATRRELGYVALNAFALCWVDACIVAVSLGIPALGMATPFYTSASQLSSWYLAAVGAALLPAACYLLAAWAAARATLVRGVLGPQSADLGRRLTEVSRSRSRLAAAFERERRSIERDLHDGAQRHLVAVSMSLGMAKLDLPAGSPGAAQVDEAHRHAERALAELRSLIRGVHPQVLTDRGLPAAVQDIAGDVPVAVEVTSSLDRRLPADREATAYFCVSEALTNVVRHSGADRAAVELALVRDELQVQVVDHGCGGATAGAGRGLTGMRDRLAAVDGSLCLQSPPGGPTTLQMRIPVGREPS